MKKSAYAFGLMIVCALVLLLASTPGARPAAAQTPLPPTPINSIDPGRPPNDADVRDLVARADKASKDATEAQSKANDVIGNANNAVNTVNLLLNFIQAGSLFGTVLAGATGILAARTGTRTLNDYRKELDKAHAELEEMRTKLTKESEETRDQADKAIRSLALMQLGEQQLEMRNIKGALQMYQQAHDLDPTNRATNYFLGELYIQDKQLDKGIDHLTNALDTETDYAPAEAALGYALRLQAEKLTDQRQRDIVYARAEERLLKALTTDPNVLDINGESVHAVLGGLYKRQGRTDKAIFRYEEARKITPNKSYPIVNLAMLYFTEGRVDQAKEAFTRSGQMASRILEINPYDFWARFDRIAAALALGETEQAMEDVHVALEQVKLPTPLESFMSDLERMKNAPQPPKGINQVIEQFQATIDRMRVATS